MVELVEKDSSVSSLLKVFNDQSSSDRIVQFLRLLTSAFIRNRADFFRHFIDEEMDIKDFCTHVGPRLPLGNVAPSLGCACLSLTHARSTVSAQRNTLTMPTGDQPAGDSFLEWSELWGLSRLLVIPGESLGQQDWGLF